MTQNSIRSFSYVYHGQVIPAEVRHFLEGANDRYGVRIDDSEVTLVRTSFNTPDGRFIWTQSNKTGEFIQPHDLMQAIGEGIDRLPGD